MPQVSINIVTWNGARYLPDLFASIDKQTMSSQIRMVDNASDDDTVKLANERGDVTLVRNARNLGFASAHNQLIKLAIDKWEGEDLNHCYVFVTNQDIILTDKTVEELVRVLEENPEVGSVQGKLLRAFIEHPGDDFLAETVCADIVDSTGLKGTLSRHFVDRGAGEMDRGQYDDEEFIFGPTGALAMYRASALEDVKFEQEYYDGNFFMYKEDSDLAWRLQHAGWSSMYVPTSVAYHHRGLFGNEKPGVIERIKNRRQKRPILATLSSRNHLYVLYKNLSIMNAALSFPFVVMITGRQLVYSIIFEPHVIAGILRGTKHIGVMTRKRAAIQSSSKRKAKEMRRYFGRS